MVSVGEFYCGVAAVGAGSSLEVKPGANEQYILFAVGDPTQTEVYLTDGVNDSLVWQPYMTPVVGTQLAIPFLKIGFNHDCWISIKNIAGGGINLSFSCIRVK